MSAGLSPSDIASLMASPAWTVFVHHAYGLGIGLTVIGGILLVVSALSASAAHAAYCRDDDASGLWALAVFSLIFALTFLGTGLPRVSNPQGFALQAMHCVVSHTNTGC